MSYQHRPILCGKPSCSKWHGPYWYAFWWADGKTRCRYVGKTLPAELAAARDSAAAPVPATSVPSDPADEPAK